MTWSLRSKTSDVEKTSLAISNTFMTALYIYLHGQKDRMRCCAASKKTPNVTHHCHLLIASTLGDTTDDPPRSPFWWTNERKYAWKNEGHFPSTGTHCPPSCHSTQASTMGCMSFSHSSAQLLNWCKTRILSGTMVDWYQSFLKRDESGVEF